MEKQDARQDQPSGQKSQDREKSGMSVRMIEIPRRIPKKSTDIHGRDRDAAILGLVDKVSNEKTRDYIQNRLVPQMRFYSDRSRDCKRQYLRWMTVSIVLGALIPVFSVFSDAAIVTKVTIAALGAAVTAVNAYLALQNSKDLWLTYRNTREVLLRTLYYYFNDAGMFSKMESQAERDTRLIEYCEDELSRENGSWRSIVVEE